MKVIQKLSEKIEEELHDAKSYTKMAMKYKDEYPDLSRTLFDIANEEIGHMNMLHEQVASIIKKYRNEKGDPPQTMLAVYEYLHSKQIAEYSKVKSLMETYKNS